MIYISLSVLVCLAIMFINLAMKKMIVSLIGILFSGVGIYVSQTSGDEFLSNAGTTIFIVFIVVFMLRILFGDEELW